MRAKVPRHLGTIRLKSPTRVEQLLFGLVAAYLALTRIGTAAHRARLRRKVCEDPVSLAWVASSPLHTPQFLKPRLACKAPLVYSWFLHYESR